MEDLSEKRFICALPAVLIARARTSGCTKWWGREKKVKKKIRWSKMGQRNLVRVLTSRYSRRVPQKKKKNITAPPGLLHSLERAKKTWKFQTFAGCKYNCKEKSMTPGFLSPYIRNVCQGPVKLVALLRVPAKPSIFKKEKAHGELPYHLEKFYQLTTCRTLVNCAQVGIRVNEETLILYKYFQVTSTDTKWSLSLSYSSRLTFASLVNNPTKFLMLQGSFFVFITICNIYVHFYLHQFSCKTFCFKTVRHFWNHLQSQRLPRSSARYKHYPRLSKEQSCEASHPLFTNIEHYF